MKKLLLFILKNLCSISGKINKSMKSLSILISCYLTRLPVSKWSDEVAWCIIYTKTYTHRRIVIMIYPRVSVCQLLDYDPFVWLTLHFYNAKFHKSNSPVLGKNETNFVYLTLIIFYISYVFHPSKMFDVAHGNY